MAKSIHASKYASNLIDYLSLCRSTKGLSIIMINRKIEQPSPRKKILIKSRKNNECNVDAKKQSQDTNRAMIGSS
jgi:hypothetical protein